MPSGPPGLSAAQEREGTANVRVTVQLMVTASPYLRHTSGSAEQQEMARAIYIATLCLSRGAVLHRLLRAFQQERTRHWLFPRGLLRCLQNVSLHLRRKRDIYKPFRSLHCQGEQTSALSLPEDFRIHSAKAQKGRETEMEKCKISRSL